MGTYLEWFRSCSRITVTVASGDRGPGRASRRTGCRSGCSSSAATAARPGCCGSRTRSPRRPGSRRAGRSSSVPWPTTPPTAAHRAAYADAEPRSFWLAGAARRRARAARRRRRRPVHRRRRLHRAVGGAATPRRDDPARDVVVLEAETAGFGASGRNGGFAVASLTHGHRERARALRRRDAGARAARAGELRRAAGRPRAPRDRLRLRAHRRAARADRRLPGAVARGGARVAASASATR